MHVYVRSDSHSLLEFCQDAYIPVTLPDNKDAHKISQHVQVLFKKFNGQHSMRARTEMLDMKSEPERYLMPRN